MWSTSLRCRAHIRAPGLESSTAGINALHTVQRPGVRGPNSTLSGSIYGSPDLRQVKEKALPGPVFACQLIPGFIAGAVVPDCSVSLMLVNSDTLPFAVCISRFSTTL